MVTGILKVPRFQSLNSDWYMKQWVVMMLNSRVFFKMMTWSIPPARSDEVIVFQAGLSQVRIAGVDSVHWILSKSSMFSHSSVWNKIWVKHEIVNGDKLIWQPLCIPKHSFKSYLSLLKQGYEGDIMFLFYRNFIQSRDHLFFECSFHS